ncbi:MAG TPA: 2-C-methyl-D-erythritol 4-phosphate cytidylyltransferase [Halanaerobiales bacterium]|nr:2-C-methyl-D-erythritol 4-phosphate cytidylyltransferase [Halanaerobiales bacterium]
MYITAIIPAAGMGSRMGIRENKLYLELEDKPVLYHTLSNFVNNSFIDDIILVLQENEMNRCEKEILTLFNKNKNKIKMVKGGKSRKESVYNGIKRSPDDTDYIIIHDGARPLITQQIINNVIGALENEEAVTTGINVKDTIKVKDSNNYVVKTINRDNLTSIQTPQAFSYDLIKKAHQSTLYDKNITDDAYLIELMNKSVKIIKGSYENIKITTPIDITIAEEILKSRRE